MVRGFTSTRTGRAPASTTAFAVAGSVYAGTMTSSSSSRQSAATARWRAALTDGLVALEREQQRVDHVVDIAPRANLRAFAVDHEIFARERADGERVNRADPDLARAVDVERANGRRRQAVLVEIGVSHVLAGELGDRVRPACLTDGAAARNMRLLDAIRAGREDLASREVQQPLVRRLRRLRVPE